MVARRLLTLNADQEPLCVRPHVQPIGERRAAMVVGDTSAPPGPHERRCQGFFRDTADEAEQLAKAFLGRSEPVS